MNLPTKTSHRIDLETIDHNIRPFPAAASKIVSLCNCAETKVAEITRLIECEPAVAVKLLAMANSPMFGARREVNNVNHAIVLLGYRTVAQLALTIAAGPLFSSGDKALMEHRKVLFRQSVGVATASKLFAERLKLADPSEAFLGGVMLDVGKLFFFDVVPEPYLEILDQYRCGDTLAVELEIFGTDHSVIGNLCGQKWGLPRQINNLIKNHHQEFDKVEDGLTQSVLAGIYHAHKWNLGFEELHDFRIREDMEDRFSDSQIDDLRDDAREQFQAILAIFANE